MSDAFVTAIEGIVGRDHRLTGPAEMEPYCTDWFGRERGAARLVARPRTCEEVARILALCAEAGVPVFPQGGNTSVCGGSIPTPEGRGIVVSLSRMNRIREIDETNGSIVVDAGCVLAQVQEAAAARGRLFPLSLSAEGSCQIGGNIATNAGGTAALRYGTMRDLVLGLEAVLPDGQIWSNLKTVRKDSTGYDLKSLFIGSEGTLGIVTGAALKLFARPDQREVAWVALPSPDAAVALLLSLEKGFEGMLTAFELMSHAQVMMVCRYVPGRHYPTADTHPWHALIEVSATRAETGLAARIEDALAVGFESGLLRDAVLARSGSQADDLWRTRHAITDALKAAGISITHDVAVPISQVPAYIEATERALQAHDRAAQGTVVCHLGDGNVHYNVTYARDHWSAHPDPEGLAAGTTQVVQDEAVKLGGTFVAEHGIGKKYLPAVSRYKSAVELQLARRLKQALDPAGIMNPGRVIPS